ncbi:unnamed protein product [Pleuronectes platessa]|uniref:Uncharacterized protein n=1 Tax=Pleuronectes platessa TaxID=8262 RepID=A0A9N7YEG7_PLEPL|nr:unnamed protein product [Pleuronectes platessa]
MAGGFWLIESLPALHTEQDQNMADESGLRVRKSEFPGGYFINISRRVSVLRWQSTSIQRGHRSPPPLVTLTSSLVGLNIRRGSSVSDRQSGGSRLGDVEVWKNNSYESNEEMNEVRFRHVVFCIQRVRGTSNKSSAASSGRASSSLLFITEVSAPGAGVKKKQQQQDGHLLNPSFGGVTPDPAPEKILQSDYTVLPPVSVPSQLILQFLCPLQVPS